MKYLTVYDELFKQTKTLNEELEEQMRENGVIKTALKTANRDLEFKKVELNDLYKDIKRVKAHTEEIARQIAEVEKEKTLADAKREGLKDDIKSASRETASQRKQSDMLKSRWTIS